SFLIKISTVSLFGFGHFFIRCVVAHLCGAFQHIQASKLRKPSVDAFPSAFHLTVHFAFAVFRAAALSVDQALGTGCDRADPACQVKITLTALIAVVFQRRYSLEARQRISIAGRVYRLVLQISGNRLYAYTAGKYKDRVRRLDLLRVLLETELQIIRSTYV